MDMSSQLHETGAIALPCDKHANTEDMTPKSSDFEEEMVFLRQGCASALRG